MTTILRQRSARPLRPELPQPPAAGHRALPLARRARGRGEARPARHAHGLAAPPDRDARTARQRQRLLGPAATPGRAGAAQHGRLPQRAGSDRHRADGARAVRHALDQARTHRRRLHAAARHAEPGRRRLATDPRRLPGAALLHRGPGAVPAPGRRRLPGRDALGGADRHRPRAASTPMRCRCCASGSRCRCWSMPASACPRMPAR